MSEDPLTIPVLPDDAEERKNTPIFDGFLNYFPLACAAVARHSKMGNDQHNPGQPLHWSRDKSTDHVNCIVRHLIDIFTVDASGEYVHARGLAWRAMAMLQILEEKRLGKPMCRAGHLSSHRHAPVIAAPTGRDYVPVSEVIHVVAGVFFSPDGGSIFLQRRALDDENFPGKWECPGGGVKKGEKDQDALARELDEELGIEALVIAEKPLWQGTIQGYLHPKRIHSFRFYVVGFRGVPVLKDGQPEGRYVTLPEAAELALTPANLLAWPEVAAESHSRRSGWTG
jgi:mutator protein MutT